MRGKLVSVALGAIAALWACTASAEEAAECHAYPSSLGKVSAMQATGAGPVHFFEAWVDGCERSAEHCQKHSYVLPGDRLLAEDAGAGFFCAWYLDGKGRESWGLLPAARLAPAKAETPAAGGLSAWAGYWRMAGLAAAHAGGKDDLSPTGEIAIVVVGRAIKASGDASYPYRDHTGELTANVGYFGGGENSLTLSAHNVAKEGVAAIPTAGRATFSEDVCRIEARRLGAYLLVVDNNQCGGMNVTFSGVYARVGPVPTKGAKP